MRRTFLARVITTAALLFAFSADGGGLIQHPNPVDPGDWPAGCSIPYGYTAACGYHASTTNGECLCREADSDTTLCMKSSASSGCGIYDHENDPCCQSSSGF